MDEQAKLSFLLDLAETLGVQVRQAPPPDELDLHPGGALVRLRERELLFLDPTASLGDRIGVAAAALAGREQLQDLFLPPEIRQLLE